jgi:hypothetical protein
MIKSSKNAIRLILQSSNVKKIIPAEDIMEAIKCINALPESRAIERYRKHHASTTKTVKPEQKTA